MSVRKYKILILYASYGDGHIQVSRALQDVFEREGQCEVVLKDLFAESYPKLNALTKYIYIKSYTLFPNLYGWSYYRTRHMRNDTWFSHWFHGWGLNRLKDIIRDEKPDCVVNTFPMLAMPELRRRTKIPIPVFTVITDFVLHMRWIHPCIDKYYVATEDLKRQIVETGIPEGRIKATGIPLKRSFQVVERTPALYRKYGIDPLKRTVLIMAGSYGVLRGLTDVCDSLASFPDTQLLIVCGKNRPLFETISEFMKDRPQAHVFGFVKELNEMMALADTMVTKPGGITLTESLQYGLPVVLFRPVPGQERDNALYLQSKGAAFIVNDTDSLLQCIKDILDNEQTRKTAVARIAALRKRNAAETIVRDILDCYRNMKESHE